MTTREQTASRLLEMSLRNQYEPELAIDWEAPLDPDLFWLPPHRSSLYGTTLWAGLSHRRRVELTKHEVAAAASGGVWFETILMQMLVRFYYDADPTTRHAQYALTEIADECRHSIMFGRLIDRIGCPVYPPNRVDHFLGRILKATARGPHMYAAILLAEEVLDSLQREIMADESLQPLVRMVSRVHVVEESRHIRFAKEELARQVEATGPIGLAYSRVVIGRAAYAVARRLIQPSIYPAVGIAPAVGAKAARTNPHFHATLRWASARVVRTLTDLGLITGPGKLLWRKANFVI